MGRYRFAGSRIRVAGQRTRCTTDCCADYDCGCANPTEVIAHVSGFTGDDCSSWNGDYVFPGPFSVVLSYVDGDFGVLCFGNCDEFDISNTGWTCGVGFLPDCAAEFTKFFSPAAWCNGGDLPYNADLSVYDFCDCDPGSPTFSLEYVF